jgi:hypothetical protein
MGRARKPTSSYVDSFVGMPLHIPAWTVAEVRKQGANAYLVFRRSEIVLRPAILSGGSRSRAGRSPWQTDRGLWESCIGWTDSLPRRRPTPIGPWRQQCGGIRFSTASFPCSRILFRHSTALRPRLRRRWLRRRRGNSRRHFDSSRRTTDCRLQ